MGFQIKEVSINKAKINKALAERRAQMDAVVADLNEGKRTLADSDLTALLHEGQPTQTPQQNSTSHG